MKNLKSPKIMGQEILKEIQKHKILLVQDKLFPNIVGLITKEQIVGSWWGHPLANPIYNGLGWLEDNSEVLSLKFLAGKVTYLAPELLPYFYSIVREKREWQTEGLSKDDFKVLKAIEAKPVKSDSSTYKTDAAKKSLEKLEKRLLVNVREEHTDSGKHVKIYQSWKVPKKMSKASYEESLAKFESLVHAMNKTSKSKVKLPWE